MQPKKSQYKASSNASEQKLPSKRIKKTKKQPKVLKPKIEVDKLDKSDERQGSGCARIYVKSKFSNS